ncbi:hypothetical protein IMG5_136990 [Ichthyophthirius multifiliis]|uniref:Large ribosomal subunit protein uL11 N-terminal domain-containing protein n=1 Tax=Ichthyophthirius multifiliis TaxID=5932 RepID=G0QX10_ICHMU|nr:hypothetical protein IMG5_136990 [Ichthyophthirius multifiliis]EGR30245.1 hypothetical protein IMG5_136990 [Ichthyophthirius multifiliis]|eukprot:XP_004031841.1 hypothetical protein IMG5_136990 [Ichthyophthirius multifiliis]
MPPKVDPNEVRFINIKVFGGEPGPASTLAPKLGPLGLNAKKVGEDIIKACNDHKGIRVMVSLKCQNRAAEVTILNTSSALLIKELGKHVRDRKKVKNGIKKYILYNYNIYINNSQTQRRPFIRINKKSCKNYGS